MGNQIYSDEPEVCSVHGCEMDGEHCPECVREFEAYYREVIEASRD